MKTISACVSVVKGAKRNLLGFSQFRDLNSLAVVNSVNESREKEHLTSA